MPTSARSTGFRQGADVGIGPYKDIQLLKRSFNMDHKNSQSASYAAAGVDITAGYRAVELMKKHVARTRNEGCLDDVGGFGGCFGLPVAGMEEPVLVSGTDGCGTKVKMAILMDKHDTIGIDAVAMCVNDIICVGAKPLFFLDYIACGKNIPEKIASIVSGVAEGCVQSGAALIGGETAEHPGMMPVEDYDLAGFAVGIVDKKKILDNTRMAEGDVVIALASTGIHSNGFSLCRKVFNIDNNDPMLYENRAELGGKTIAETLLTPTKIYVKSILALLEQVDVKGISHITGGGFYENIPRSIPDGLCAKIDKSAVRVLPIFDLIASVGNIPERDMYNTYNMGVGMSVVVPAEQAQKALEILNAHGETAYVIGSIIKNEEKVILE
jgi:phosphoribosylformylglycinamidine cyclo-ligase